MDGRPFHGHGADEGWLVLVTGRSGRKADPLCRAHVCGRYHPQDHARVEQRYFTVAASAGAERKPIGLTYITVSSELAGWRACLSPVHYGNDADAQLVPPESMRQ